MNNNPTIRELLDACRADQHDPQRPEFAAELAPLARELQANPELQQAAERSERFDRNIRAALDDVAVPAGLMERMLAGCEAANKSELETPDVEKVALPTRSKWSRRQLLAILSTAASLLILLVAGYQTYIWIFPIKDRLVGIDQLTASANTWCDLSGAGAKWLTGSTPTKEFPLDRSIIVAPTRWAQIDKNTVVYELNVKREGKRARLFVQRTNRPHQLKSLPSKLSTSGAHAMHAWQRDGYVYVIEFAEPDQRLQNFVRPTPIT